jgi:hypothetical protein
VGSQVTTIALWLRGLPSTPRYVIEGAVSVGLVGAIAGLVIGLLVHAPTAPFAAVELGVPGATLGGFAGLAVGGVVSVAQRANRGPLFGHTPDYRRDRR